MTKGRVLVIGSNATQIELQGGGTGPTGNYFNETRRIRQPITSLQGSRVCTKEMKHDESSARSQEGAQGTKRRSILEWYFILRTHHQWTIFQAIRYALWLVR